VFPSMPKGENVGHGVMVLALMSKRAKMINVDMLWCSHWTWYYGIVIIKKIKYVCEILKLRRDNVVGCAEDIVRGTEESLILPDHL
jgi:hypothetical protein